MSTCFRAIAGAIEIVVQQDRLPDGKRVITQIMSLDRSNVDALQLHPRYVYDEKSGKHRGVKTGDASRT